MDFKHCSYYAVLLTGIPIFLVRTKLWILIVMLLSLYFVTKKIYKHLCGQLVMEGKAVLITGCDTGKSFVPYVTTIIFLIVFWE